MIFKNTKQLSTSGVPHARYPIVITGQEPHAISGEGHGLNQLAMAG
jgi:hypothetical protein